MSGYVRIHRTLIDHPAFRTDAEAMAFAWLVARASWRSIRIRYKGHGVCLERGQLAISVREFAVAMDRDKAWVERLLKRLKNEDMIETASETGVTVVTICNYDKYQSDSVLCETIAETSVRQTRDTEQRREKGKKEKIDLPDWLPEEPWKAFKRMRQAMKVPFTIDAERGIIADLERLKGEGHDLTKVLEKAVKRGWRGVFGDEDTKAKGRAGTVSPEDRIANIKKDIAFYTRTGRMDDVERCRRKLAALEKPPDGAIGDLIAAATASVSVNRAA